MKASFSERIRSWFRPARKPEYDRLVSAKLDLIDYACQRFPIRTVADLGGVWMVDGGYSFYALEQGGVEKAFLVDTDFTPAVHARRERQPGMEIIQGNFGDPDTAAAVGEVDAIFLFDVLLHQVAPDWDEVLALYAPRTRLFLIYNQQFTALPHTVRLLDLGREEYFRHVPHSPDEGPYLSLFEKLNEIHPQHQRPYRDIHNVWQWGIVDADLTAKMRELGFEQVYFKDLGRFADTHSFENHAFIFQKFQGKHDGKA